MTTDVLLAVCVAWGAVVSLPVAAAADLVQGERDRGARHEFTADAAFAGRTLWNPASMAVVWDGASLLALRLESGTRISNGLRTILRQWEGQVYRRTVIGSFFPESWNRSTVRRPGWFLKFDKPLRTAAEKLS